MSITIVKAGICDTIQDAGRKGYAAEGINPGGAMDILAMQAANSLVLNPLNTAVIEMHFPAPIFFFDRAALISLSGADFNAVIKRDARSELDVAVNKTAFISAGSTLLFKKKNRGERCYLSVHGGFDLPVWLKNYSTNLKIQEGGFKGRMFKAGDMLTTLKKDIQPQNDSVIYPWTANVQSWYADDNAFNILPGPEWHWLEPTSQKKFLSNQFTIAKNSDRMGFGLEGVPLLTGRNEQLLSSGVNYGTIQLLPNGNMIILAADHPLTGGYPRIANIISAHLPKLAQATPGTSIRFLETSLDHAEKMMLLMNKEILQLQQALQFKLHEKVWKTQAR